MAGLAIVTPYSDLRLNGTWLAACHLPVGAFCCFLALALVVAFALTLVFQRRIPGT